jgi:hypothetical protein
MVRLYGDGTIQPLRDFCALLVIFPSLMKIHSELFALSLWKTHNALVSSAYMDRVKSGQKKITAKQFPSIFYDMSLYDPKNKKSGFLRGHAIVRVRCGLSIQTSNSCLENRDGVIYSLDRCRHSQKSILIALRSQEKVKSTNSHSQDQETSCMRRYR